MKVVGFSGKSGSGKSYRALSIAKENGLELVVDDGLLIGNNKILAGTSAKKEKTRYASTKRAIFMDPVHAAKVAAKIVQYHADGLLIVGTSDKMVDVIANKLGISKVDEYIHIEDVATKKEMEIASYMRNKQGKHVIPVSTVEAKKSFSGYFLDPLGTIRKFADGLFDKSDEQERTIMRPAYSYLGDYVIADKVLQQIAMHEAQGCEGVKTIARVQYLKSGQKNIFQIDAILEFGIPMQESCRKIQHRVSVALDTYASVYVDCVNVNVVGITK